MTARKKQKIKEGSSDMTKEKKAETENRTLETETTEETVVEMNAETQPSENTDVQSEENAYEVLKAQYDELNDKYLRLNAEFQNYRKRVEKEKNDIFKFGNEKLIIEMLPLMDNFERALAHVDDETIDDKVIDGIKLIKKNFDEFFEKQGVKKIEALNTPFDHDKHHAVMSEDSEEHDEETVIEVFQEGYQLNDKVIRPSMVKVTK